MDKLLHIRTSDPADASDWFVSKLTSLINHVYTEAEGDLWKIPDWRTNKDEIAGLLKTSQLLLAEWEHSLAGCVLVRRPDDSVAEFAMLAVDKKFRDFGIGNALVSAAEAWAQEHNCSTIQLELLTPKMGKNASKEVLKAWYTRLGYVPKYTKDFYKLYPERAVFLATECDFTVWVKAL